MKPLTILVASVNAVGHVNACSGALSALVSRGHRVIFVIEEAFKGKLVALGYEEFIYTVEKAENEQNPGEVICTMLIESKVLGDYSPLEKLENTIAAFHGGRFYDEIRVMDQKLREAIEKFEPDLIYHDGGFLYPVIHYSGIPWVKNISCTPLLFTFTDELPPGASGLPSDSDPEKFAPYNKLRKSMFYSSNYSELIKSMGYDPFPEDATCPESHCLTVYAYPDELDYPYIRNLGWFNLEVFNKNALNEVVDLNKLLPEKFINDTLDGQFSGKWIYVSMGSMGSVDLTLMDRIIKALSKTNHKYIVSKGPRHSEYQLPRNMWGDRYLPQTKIIPLMDLVITHGGNNTTTETFAQGKPMIVLPLFGDQFDNAQRVYETGYGTRLEPYKFTEQEMISAVEELLNDTELHQKLVKASQRIQSENRCELLAYKIEELVATKSK